MDHDRRILEFLEIDRSIQVGWDMDGKALFDGDRVLSFNLMDPSETWPLSKPKIGVPATLRRSSTHLFVVRTSTGTGTGCDPSDPESGVISQEPDRTDNARQASPDGEAPQAKKIEECMTKKEVDQE